MASDDVTVKHVKDGCPIDGKKTEHKHTQADWRAEVDKAGEKFNQGKGS